MQPSLTDRVRSGVTWNTASVLLTYGVGLGRSIALARLLTPDVYGLFGMAITPLGLLSLLTNVGFETFLITTRLPGDEDQPDHLNTIWTAELVRRCLLTLLLLAIVYPTAQFYGEERLSQVLPLMALTPLINGFRNIGLVLDRKRISFRKIVFLEQATNVISATAAIALAFRTRNVWALVVSQLLSAAVGVGLSYQFHPYRPRLAFHPATFRRAFNFGKYASVIGVSAYITTTADNIFLGRLWGAEVLGVYVVAYNLASLPVAVIGNVLSAVLTPAYAELRDQSPRRLERAFVRVFGLSCVLLLLMIVPTVVLAEEIILTLYGAKWLAAGPLLRILALVGFCRGQLFIVAPFLLNVSGLRAEAKVKVMEAVIFLVLLYPLTTELGAAGAAWAGASVYLLTIINRYWSIKVLAPGMFGQLKRALSAALLAGLAGIAVGTFVVNTAQTTFARLIGGALASTAAMMMLLFWLMPGIQKEARAVAREFRRHEVPSQAALRED